jgi:hypothetical protein
MSNAGPWQILKSFLIEDIFHMLPVSTTLVVHLELEEFSKKFEMALMGYSGALGKLIHEKNLKSKISWHCPFTPLDGKEMSSI